MLESVISLSEAENTNNSASPSLVDMTLEDKEDTKRHEEDRPTTSTSSSAPQHFAKNPNRAARNTHHIKAKRTQPTEEPEDSDNEYEDEIVNKHRTLSQQNSDRTYENFTLARKEGRPIYAVRANYRFVSHSILFVRPVRINITRA